MAAEAPFSAPIVKNYKSVGGRASYNYIIMPYRKEQFINGDIYHITTRAIDNNLIFKDINDYYRGIFSIYEFNNVNSTEIWRRRRERIAEKKKSKALEDGSPTLFQVDKREKLVEILAFCFMPNHIHLLLKQIKDNGIVGFMRKVGTGYASYFNKKYERKGYVFQNRFKDIRIKDDNQLKTIFTYIHTNPLSLIEPGWKKAGIKDFDMANKFLEEYKWHSYLDFIGIKNFPSVTEREFLLEAMGGVDCCREAIKDWVKYKKEIKQSPDILLN